MHAISWEFFNFRHHLVGSTSASEIKKLKTPVTTSRRNWGFLLTENRISKLIVLDHLLGFHRDGFVIDRCRVLYRFSIKIIRPRRLFAEARHELFIVVRVAGIEIHQPKRQVKQANSHHSPHGHPSGQPEVHDGSDPRRCKSTCGDGKGHLASGRDCRF